MYYFSNGSTVRAELDQATEAPRRALSEYRDIPNGPRRPEPSSSEHPSNSGEHQPEPSCAQPGNQSPDAPERDAMGRNGTGNKNFCPTDSPDSQAMDPDNDWDLEDLDFENPFSQLARDLLEVLESEEDGLEESGAPESLLTERQKAALPYIAAFPNMRQAARAAGIGKSTLYRWMEDESFREEVTRLREAAAQLARVQLQGQMLNAVQVLSDAMDHEDPAIRLRAARYVLQYGLQVGEVERLASDLENLQNSLHLGNLGSFPN